MRRAGERTGLAVLAYKYVELSLQNYKLREEVLKAKLEKAPQNQTIIYNQFGSNGENPPVFSSLEPLNYWIDFFSLPCESITCKLLVPLLILLILNESSILFLKYSEKYFKNYFLRLWFQYNTIYRKFSRKILILFLCLVVFTDIFLDLWFYLR